MDAALAIETVATKFDVLDSAVLEIQEWASVFWANIKGLGGRFISKKLLTDDEILAIVKTGTEENLVDDYIDPAEYNYEMLGHKSREEFDELLSLDSNKVYRIKLKSGGLWQYSTTYMALTPDPTLQTGYYYVYRCWTRDHKGVSTGVTLVPALILAKAMAERNYNEVSPLRNELYASDYIKPVAEKLTPYLTGKQRAPLYCRQDRIGNWIMSIYPHF